MIFQLLLLAVLILVSPLLPPILVPLSYSFTGALIVQKTNPRVLSIVSVGASTLGAVIIRFIQNHIIRKLTFDENIKGTTLFSRTIKKINNFFKNEEKIAKISLKREKYIETKTGRTMTFLFAVFCYFPILPDIIGTRVLYKKIRFRYFVIAVIIGKSVTHVPFIFVGKTVFQLLGW
jgi:membrane protein YqaA with SNARE-associated domain